MRCREHPALKLATGRTETYFIVEVLQRAVTLAWTDGTLLYSAARAFASTASNS